MFARPGTDGERHTAASAAARIRARLLAFERTERPIEYRFSLPDTWSRTLFVALLRRYGLKHYRYHGQRRTTVMVRVTKSFVDQTLWPEFQQLLTVLEEHLEEVARGVIDNALGSDDTSTEMRPGAMY